MTLEKNSLIYEQAKKMYLEDKKSLTQIGKELNISRNKLSYFFKQDNIEIKTRKYEIDENVFEKIDTEEKAYWLGFLYADGNIGNYDKNSIDISLAEKDKNHLEKFKKFLKSDKEIITRTNTLNNKIFYSCRFCIDDKKVHDDLIDKGCFPNKSLILKFPTIEQVPEHLVHHFIRGYFDGDGCIGYNENRNKFHFSINGTNEFLSKMVENFKKNIKDYKETKIYKDSRSNVYQIQKGGVIGGKTVNGLYNYLYKDATIYLDRKYEKFKQAIKK